MPAAANGSLPNLRAAPGSYKRPTAADVAGLPAGIPWGALGLAGSEVGVFEGAGYDDVGGGVGQDRDDDGEGDEVEDLVGGGRRRLGGVCEFSSIAVLLHRFRC